jgi:hypothetical protein
MPKTIKVVITTILELPSKAEVIRFKDEDGIETDHIKFLGKLFPPDVCWLQYNPAYVNQKKWKIKSIGMGWESVDDETSMKYFQSLGNEQWYMEEG